MLFRIVFTLSMSLAIAFSAVAGEQEDLEFCRQYLKQSGVSKYERVDNFSACTKQKTAERRARSIAEYNAREQARYEAEVKARAKEKAERMARDREWEEQYAKEEAEREARAQAARDKAEQERLEQQVAVEQKKKECGEDYRKVRVGMTLERVEQCVGPFELTSQLNRIDGVLSTYRRCSNYRCGYLHVMEGIIVAWEAP